MGIIVLNIIIGLVIASYSMTAFLVIAALGIALYIYLRVDGSKEKERRKEEGEKLKKLAENGKPQALFDYGVWLRQFGPSSALPEARACLEKALAHGIKDAKLQLRFCEAKERGITMTNDTMVFNNNLEKAKLGKVFDQWMVGLVYKNGSFSSESSYIYGMNEPDMVKAAYWFKKAAEQGDVLAQEELAECYLEGQGVEKDEKTALLLLYKAAESGNIGARSKIEKLTGLTYEEFVLKNT